MRVFFCFLRKMLGNCSQRRSRYIYIHISFQQEPPGGLPQGTSNPGRYAAKGWCHLLRSAGADGVLGPHVTQTATSQKVHLLQKRCVFPLVSKDIDWADFLSKRKGSKHKLSFWTFATFGLHKSVASEKFGDFLRVNGFWETRKGLVEWIQLNTQMRCSRKLGPMQLGFRVRIARISHGCRFALKSLDLGIPNIQMGHYETRPSQETNDRVLRD